MYHVDDVMDMGAVAIKRVGQIFFFFLGYCRHAVAAVSLSED